MLYSVHLVIADTFFVELAALIEKPLYSGHF